MHPFVRIALFLPFLMLIAPRNAGLNHAGLNSVSPSKTMATKGVPNVPVQDTRVPNQALKPLEFPKVTLTQGDTDGNQNQNGDTPPEPDPPNPIITRLKRVGTGLAVKYGNQAWEDARKAKKASSPSGGRIKNSGLYEPAPKQGPPVKGATKMQGKTPVRGGGKMRDRWRLPDGKLLEWDGQEHEWEIYDRTGKHHLGAINQEGYQTGDALPNRSIEK